MLADKPETLDLQKLPSESADYLRAQDDRIAFLSELILEHKRRAALRGLLDEHFIDVPRDEIKEQELVQKMDALGG